MARRFEMPRVDPQQQDVDPLRVATILDAAELEGLELPYSCCSGVCSTCKARLQSGVVSHLENHVLEAAELAAGWVLVCQAIPLSESVEIDYEDTHDNE